MEPLGTGACSPKILSSGCPVAGVVGGTPRQLPITMPLRSTWHPPLLLFAALVLCQPRAAAPQYFVAFPDDRNNCHSDDLPCIVGNAHQANVFPVRTTIVPEFNTPKGIIVVDRDASHFIPPEDFEFDYTGGLQPRAAEYVLPSTYMGEKYEEQDRKVFTEMAVTVTINASGHFEPAHVGIRQGALVTWALSTWEDAAVLADNSAFSFSGRLNRNGGRSASTSFTVRFGNSSDADDERNMVDAVGPPEGLVHVSNPYAWDVQWRRRDGTPSTESYPAATGTILVRKLICSELANCSSCLLYDECIWCAGNATCMTRNSTNNLPLDEMMVIMAGPDSSTDGSRSFSMLRYYMPTFGN